MISGGSIVIIPEDVRLDVSALNVHMSEHGVTQVLLPTKVAQVFTSSVKDSSLRILQTGGEQMGDMAIPAGYSLMNCYGPTENTVCGSAGFVSKSQDRISVGVPCDNVKAYILDREHRRVPIGAVGELYLSGYQLSKGYLNNPEKNRESFFDNPFSSEPGYERMYATGDYFRILPDGTLGVLGRRDGQIKVRGNRVELTEVEACIGSMPGIENVTVQPIVAGNGSKELCAYIVSSSPISAADVQSHVRSLKPGYMVPAFVIQLEQIPLNFNGKVDRRALPKPDLSALRAEYATPRNEFERVLCDAFSQ